MDLEFVTNNWYLFLALALISLMLIFDATRRGTAGAKQISAIQLPQLISHESAVVVDICEQDEYNKGHIQRALNLPLSNLKEQVNRISKFRDKPVVLACQSGNRAGRAATILKQNDFSNIYILAGGMQSWRKENLPVVKS